MLPPRVEDFERLIRGSILSRVSVPDGSSDYEVYAWDNEGRMTSLQGPDNGPLATYTFDAMGGLTSGGATYGPAGELLTFNGVTRNYSLGQLTRMTKAGAMDIEYRYTAGQNNGRIVPSKDYVSGGSAGFQSDFAQAGKDNDKLVDKNCGKLIGV